MAEIASLRVVPLGPTAGAVFDQRVRAYLRNLKSRNTYRAYQADWSDFTHWCEASGAVSLPTSAPTVMRYLVELADSGRKTATITRRATSISRIHEIAGFESLIQMDPVRKLLKAVRRTLGTAGAAGKAPLLAEDVRAMLSQLSANLLGLRNRALLLVGFAGALRRSELVALDVEDISFMSEGVVLTLRRGNTNPEGSGREVAIPFGSHEETCPVAALRTWFQHSGITEGPLFRSVNRHGHLLPGRLSGTAVAQIVKRCAGAAGLDPRQYASHSLRAGLAIAAALGGAPDWAIQRQTGHRSPAMLARYIRSARGFKSNAASFAGL